MNTEMFFEKNDTSHFDGIEDESEDVEMRDSTKDRPKRKRWNGDKNESKRRKQEEKEENGASKE